MHTNTDKNKRKIMMKKPVLLSAALLIAVLPIAGCLQGNVSNNGWGVSASPAFDLGSLSRAASSVLGNNAALSPFEISAGLREALNVGTGIVVGQLGQTNGFNLDPQIRIPLPSSLQKVDSALKAVGMNSLTSDLENRLNRAAELATPKAKSLFLSAIQNMTINDAQQILTGPDNAATQYLRSAMGAQLTSEMQPIITQTLSQAGAMQAYDQVTRQYNAVPFMSALGITDAKTALNDYVSEKALDGIFYYVAKEEAAIRNNPAKRTTELLQKVFSQ